MIPLLAYVVAFLLPLEEVVYLSTGVYNPLKPYRLAAAVLVLVWLFAALAGRVRLRWRWEDTALLTIFLLGALLALGYHVIGGRPASSAFRTAQLIFFGLVLYAVLKSTAFDRRHVVPLLLAYAAGALVSVLVGLYFESWDAKRFRGAYTNPNQLGHALTVVTLFSIYLMLRGRRLSRLVAVTLLPAVLAALVLTGSRTAILGLGAALAIGLLFLSEDRGSRFKLIGVGTIGVIITALVLLQTQLLADLERVLPRFHLANIATGAGRFDLWRSALTVGMDHGFLGIGMGRYIDYHLEYIQQFDAYPVLQRYALSTHSDFISLLVEYGFLALLLYLAILTSISRRLLRSLRHTWEPTLILVVAAIFIGTIVQGAGRLSFIIPDFWLIMAVSFLVLVPPRSSPGGGGSESRPEAARAEDPWRLSRPTASGSVRS